MNAIETRHLTKYYGKTRGITDVSLDIQKGEIFGFIGPNGAGKSTTIRTLLGFLHPTGGTASIMGKDCFKDIARIKLRVGYVPSEINYYDDMKVKDLLAYSGKFYKKDCTMRINELCSIFEVETGKWIHSLSFGNRKKVAVVQALLHEPELLILDEPTSGLDPLMQNRFFEILRDENKKGVTIFFSSHILSEVEKMCDRVAIIKEGRILKVEKVDKLRSNRYKRLRLEFAPGSETGDLNLQGVADLKSNGTRVEMLYSGNMDDLIRKLSSRSIENLWVEEPSLEDVFMHYYEKEGK